jgi:asparaginyl-tRNA synthetase
MVEPEAAFFDLDDVMQLAEEFVANLVRRVLERRRDDLAVLERDVSRLEPAANTPYPRLTYAEAVAFFHAQGHPFEAGNDLGAPDETLLGKHFDRPVLVHRWPQQVKAFYMKRDPADPTKALCVDMLGPEGVGELIGGSQREDDLEALERRIDEHELPKEAFEWYLDLRRYGSVPHSGFGIGLERTVGWICGTQHVRETIPFPRMMNRLRP